MWPVITRFARGRCNSIRSRSSMCIARMVSMPCDNTGDRRLRHHSCRPPSGPASVQSGFRPPLAAPSPRLRGRVGVGAVRPIRIRPCRPMWEPIVAVKAASPQLSRKRSVVGGAATVIPRPTKPGSLSITGSAGSSSACPSWRAFTCFGRASTCARSRRSAQPGARRVRQGLTTRIPMTPTPSMSKTNRLTPWRRARQAHRPAMSDNPAMRRFRPRWLSALLGGIVLPFDPVLGMVMLMVGLWPKRKAAPRVVK
jgi:hypothetical protein